MVCKKGVVRHICVLSNKRGVSPLIATVLLFAFAVSLGAVVINLGLNLFGDPCAERSIEVFTADNSPRMCLIKSTQTLTLTVVNNGKKNLDGFKLSVAGNVAYNEDVPEFLEPLDKKVISYPVPELDHAAIVSLIPYYESSGQPEYCPQQQIDYTSVRDC